MENLSSGDELISVDSSQPSINHTSDTTSTSVDPIDNSQLDTPQIDAAQVDSLNVALQLGSLEDSGSDASNNQPTKQMNK